MDFALSLRGKKRQRLLAALESLARNPFSPADYQELDADGRTNEVILEDEFLITYWLDHAVKEIRVKEIMEV